MSPVVIAYVPNRRDRIGVPIVNLAMRLFTSRGYRAALDDVIREGLMSRGPRLEATKLALLRAERAPAVVSECEETP